MSMLFEDYIYEVEACASEFIIENADEFDNFESIYDAMFVDDSVTGNSSGSFTFDRFEAAENVADLIYDEEFADRCRELGYEGVPFDDGPEAIDVLARCIALSDMAGDLERYWDEARIEEEEDEVED